MEWTLPAGSGSRVELLLDLVLITAADFGHSWLVMLNMSRRHILLPRFNCGAANAGSAVRLGLSTLLVPAPTRKAEEPQQCTNNCQSGHCANDYARYRAGTQSTSPSWIGAAVAGTAVDCSDICLAV